MPHKHAAVKWLRKTKKRTVKNNSLKANLEFLARQLEKAILAKDKTKTDELARKLVQALDKAAEKRVLHQNNAARKKSRMMKKVNGLK
ncbi:MAG: 30S ribosomal protein S20 [Patescibacteria group bacterium]|nr:30S ribosomal protein S20 [Patescibacteria group bacterium]